MSTTSQSDISTHLNLANFAPQLASLNITRVSQLDFCYDTIVDASRNVITVPREQVLCPAHPLHSKTSVCNELITKHPFYQFFEEFFFRYQYRVKMNLFAKEIFRRFIACMHKHVDRLPLGTLFPAEFNMFVEENRWRFDLTPITGSCFRDGLKSKCLVWKANFGTNSPSLAGITVDKMQYEIKEEYSPVEHFRGTLNQCRFYWNAETLLFEVSFSYKMQRLRDDGVWVDKS